MKKLLLSLFLISASLYARPHASPELAAPLKTLYSMKETRQLLETVEAHAPLALKTAYFGKHASNAAWYPDERTIYINFSQQRTQGSVIRSLIFELHNALHQRQFDELDTLAMHGQISRSKYVLKVEEMEYQNALKTVELIKQGIRQGLFPKDAAHWPVAPNFSEHFRVQKEAGHAQAIANMYDQLRQHHLAKK